MKNIRFAIQKEHVAILYKKIAVTFQSFFYSSEYGQYLVKESIKKTTLMYPWS